MFEFRRRKRNSKNIKICPLCKKPSLSMVFNGLVAGRHKCTNCEYEGTFYLEINPEEKGENFANMEKLKEIFQEDIDPTTEIDLKDLKELEK